MKLYKIPIQTIVPVTNFQSRTVISNQSRSVTSNQSRGLASSQAHAQKENMSYRYYPSWSTHTIVLFHGLVSSSIYLSALAHRLAERKIAQVILPDLRGHGDDQRNLKWDKNHDVIQDFEEMMIHFKSRTAVERISFMGHSFGARWMIKILREASPSFRVDHSYLIAPFLQTQQLMGDWLTLANNQYQVNWPDGIRTGREVFQYPKEFLDMFSAAEESALPNGSGKSDLSQARGNVGAAPIALPNGSYSLFEAGQDEILSAVSKTQMDLFKDQIVLPEATHMGIVIEKNSVEKICDLVEKNIYI